MFAFKKFQIEDYARAATHDGAIIAHDTGGGKTIGMYALAAIKVGFETADHAPRSAFPAPRSLRPLAPVLFIAPGDLHGQIISEGALHFRATVTHLDCQETFLRLSTLDPATGRRVLPAGYYITSYTELATNKVEKFTCTGEQITPQHRREFFEEAPGMQFFQKALKTLRSPAGSSYRDLEYACEQECRYVHDPISRGAIRSAFRTAAAFTPKNGGHSYDDLDATQRETADQIILENWAAVAGQGIGESHWIGRNTDTPRKVACVHSPSLADLCCDAFACVCVDEGVRMKGEDTLIGQGVRRMNPPYRYVFTATPVKNRLPDVFWLAWWATGGCFGAHARFPYDDSPGVREAFASEFCITERNLSKEEEKGGRFVKLTPQVCNVHRVWKMMAPIILRRRKKDFGLDIVPMHRQLIRVPMGLEQARTYRYHLDADYLDKNKRPAIGAQLQALRIAAANPCSGHLQRIGPIIKAMADQSDRSDHISTNPHTPKLHAALNLVSQILARGEQFVVFSAFHDSLDQLGAKLKEAGVPFCALDGRVTQARRSKLAAAFKLGPAKAGVKVQSPYAGMLAGVECMAEGHSFPLCNNVILMCYSWAMDKFLQAIARVHRLNSIWPVNVYAIICDGSIDRRLESLIGEKSDAAELVLDGRLVAEQTEEVNLWDLLKTARQEFDAGAAVDEKTLESQWPQVRHRISQAVAVWNAPTVLQTVVRIPLVREEPVAFSVPITRAPRIQPAVPAPALPKRDRPFWQMELAV